MPTPNEEGTAFPAGWIWSSLAQNIVPPTYGPKSCWLAHAIRESMSSSLVRRALNERLKTGKWD